MKNLPLIIGGLAIGGYLLYKSRQDNTDSGLTPPPPDNTNDGNTEAPNQYIQETRPLLEQVQDNLAATNSELDMVKGDVSANSQDVGMFGADLESYQSATETALSGKASADTLNTFEQNYNAFYDDQQAVNTSTASTLSNKANQAAVDTISADLDGLALDTQTALDSKFDTTSAANLYLEQADLSNSIIDNTNAISNQELVSQANQENIAINQSDIGINSTNVGNLQNAGFITSSYVDDALIPITTDLGNKASSDDLSQLSTDIGDLQDDVTTLGDNQNLIVGQISNISADIEPLELEEVGDRPFSGGRGRMMRRGMSNNNFPFSGW